jgi:polar amino acid transport system substrate-binding protein
LTVEGRSDCLSLLQDRSIDAATTDESILSGLAAQDPTLEIVGEGFHDQPYGLAISFDHPDLTRFVNGVLEEIKANGRWTEIFERWLGREGPLGEEGLEIGPPPVARYRDR